MTLAIKILVGLFAVFGLLVFGFGLLLAWDCRKFGRCKHNRNPRLGPCPQCRLDREARLV